MLGQALGLSGLDLLLVELNLRDWLSDGLYDHIHRVALGAGLRARPGAIHYLRVIPTKLTASSELIFCSRMLSLSGGVLGWVLRFAIFSS